MVCVDGLHNVSQTERPRPTLRLLNGFVNRSLTNNPGGCYVKAKRWEEVYHLWSNKSVPTELGRKQFHDYDSHGIKPVEPDPYFTDLMQGKKWFSVQQASMRDAWMNPDKMLWHGFYQLHLDWTGRRWVLRYLLNWYPGDLPEWIDKEGDIEPY